MVFFKGVAIGFLVAAPIGPIGILCLYRTWLHGKVQGMVTGLGAATADAVYASVAGFGLTVISNLLVREQLWIRLVGGLILLVIGVRFLWSVPPQDVTSVRPHNLGVAFTGTFFLTLTNPITILAFGAIFAGLGVVAGLEDYSGVAALVVGVFTGSLLWFSFLVGLAGFLRNRFNYCVRLLAGKIFGIVILLFGIIALFSAHMKSP